MIRVLLYQSPKFRDILLSSLKDVDGFKVVGSLYKISDCRRHVFEVQPDVILLDISLDRSLDFLKTIKRDEPNVKIVVLTDVCDTQTVLKCLANGADGYLLLNKTRIPRLLEFIEDSYRGEVPMSPSLIREIFKKNIFRDSTSDDKGLTQREQEVLQLLVNGLSYKAVSGTLDIALDTVRSHVRNIYHKLKVNSKTEAVVVALKESIAVSF